MIKDLVAIFRDIALRHKGVKTFRYQNDTYNNAQNNHNTYQVYVDTIGSNYYFRIYKCKIYTEDKFSFKSSI